MGKASYPQLAITEWVTVGSRSPSDHTYTISLTPTAPTPHITLLLLFGVALLQTTCLPAPHPGSKRDRQTRSV